MNDYELRAYLRTLRDFKLREIVKERAEIMKLNFQIGQTTERIEIAEKAAQEKAQKDRHINAAVWD